MKMLKRTGLLVCAMAFVAISEAWAEGGHVVVVREGEEAGQVPLQGVSVAYLGVSTAPGGETLAKQLGLAKGEGLVVNHVDPKSPAAGKLQAHDVLQKLNDQALTDEQQLATLIRTFKPGDEVTLAVIRAAKPSTVTVKLAERKGLSIGLGAGGQRQFFFALPGGEEGEEGEEAEEGVEVKEGAGHPLAFNLNIGEDAKSSITMVERKQQYTLTTAQDGSKQAKVTDKDSKVLFEGPVDTREQMEKVPADLRGKITELKAMGTRVQLRVGAPGAPKD